MSARLDVMIAIEWCGIIARMYDVSPTVIWLRTRKSDSAKTITEPAKIAMLARVFLYMASMNASMMNAIVAPIRTAM